MQFIAIFLGVFFGWQVGRKLDVRKNVLTPYERQKSLFGGLRTTGTIAATAPNSFFGADASAYARPNPVLRPDSNSINGVNDPLSFLPSIDVR